EYKSRRLTKDSFGFEAKSVKTDGTQLFLFSKTKKHGMQAAVRMSEPLKQPVTKDSRVAYAFGRWYFLSPYTETVMEPKPQQQQYLVLRIQ
ncbi:MAG: hypothetical protein RLZZ184_2207, partial [Cyanobacteriota bacterium]